MADWLETIANRVRQKRQVDLDQAALGSELFGSLQRLLLSGETFSLNDCDVTASEAGSLDIKGTSNSLSWAQPVSVQICLVASSANRRDCILLVELPDKALEPYLECFDEDVYDTVSEIADVQRCVFSSAELPYPGNWPAEYPVEKLGVGVNFLGKVTLDDYFAECLSDACGSQPFSEKAVGLIGDFQKEEGNPQRCLRLRKTPSGKLGSTEIGVIKIELRQIDLSIALDVEEDPEVHVSGSVTIGQAPPFDVSAAIDWFDESVTVSFQNLPSLSDLLDLIKDQGLDPLREWFKGHLNLQLSELWIKLYWPGAGAGSAAADGDDERVLAMGFSLTTDNPIPLFANDFKITPKLEMQISYPFSETMRTLEGTVSGKCKLGEVELEGKLAIPGWSFSAELDSKLDSLVSPLGLGTIGLPEELKQRQVKFTVSGDVPAKFYSARLEITEPTKPNEPNATWSGTGVAQNWKLTRVAIEVDYDGSNEDNKFSYWLNATLEISRSQGDPYRFDVEGGYDEGWFLSGSTESEIDVSQLINDLLQGLSLPMQKQDLKLTNVALSANFTSGDFSLSGQTAGAWTLFDGLSLNVEHFSFDKSKDISARILVSLTIPDVATLRLSAEKPASPNAGWQFEGSTGPGQKIPIGTLIEKGVQLFDKSATVPPALEGFTIENLKLSFNTKDKEFHFTCEGKLPLIADKPPFEATVTIDIGKERHFGGQLIFHPKEGKSLYFDLKFAQKSEAKTFLAINHNDPGLPISVDTLLRQVFTESITTGLELTLKDALFGYCGDQEVSKFLFGLDIGLKIGLSNLPLVGRVLPEKLDVSIDDLQVLYAKPSFSLTEVNALNALIPSEVGKKLPSSKAESGQSALNEGLNISANLKLGGNPQPLTLPAPDGSAPSAAPPPEAPEGGGSKKAAASGVAKWFSIQKTLGPIQLQRIGVEYKEQRVGFLFDAGVEFLGVRLGLLGLGLSLPLSKPSIDKLQPRLDGLELAVKKPPLEISGALMKVSPLPPGVSLQYDGKALIRTDFFSLSALGSYAVIKDEPSLFIFAVLHKELGGPSFFFVTGLAFGFGVNRLLKLPAIEDVQYFPLIKGATDPDYFGGSADPGSAMEKLQAYIPPSKGDYWLAAGVKFNSFGMIDSFAMLSVSFGTQLQIAILGMSKITVPKQLPGAPPVDPVANAELAIKVSFSPATGILAAEARLTDNSFLFTKDCRLTGGFAFYCWFAGDHEGDFVVTLGGYHPQFPKPAHYPVVPRLRIHWPVSAELSITGEAYFALTPSCLMAGGKLEAVFQSGPIRAWFYARADFLIAWKPFRYDIEAGVAIGVSYRTDIITLTVELAASVHMWGPPFGGIAHVTCYVISFDIPFGKQEPDKPAELTWEEFHRSFLPQSKEGGDPLVSTIRITGGLMSEREVGAGNEKRTLKLVNAYQFSFLTDSLIPSTELSLNAEKAKVEASKLGIRPMGKTTLDSKHKVSLTKRGDSQNEWGKYLDFKAVPKNVPFALWSKDPSPLKTPSAELIPKVPTGLHVSLKKRDPIHALDPIDLKNFQYAEFSNDIPWKEYPALKEIAAPGEKTTLMKKTTLMNTIWGNPAVAQTRTAILNVLAKAKEEIESIKLSDVAANAKRIFQAMPEMAELGEPLKLPKST